MMYAHQKAVNSIKHPFKQDIYIYIYMVPPPHESTDFGLKGLFGFTSVTQHTIGGSMEGGFIAIGRRV